MKFKSKLLLFVLPFMCLASCSYNQSMIKQKTFLDLTCASFPLFRGDTNEDQKKLFTFKEYSSFRNHLFGFEDLIIGDNLYEQLLQIEGDFNHYSNAYIFLIVGTFGTSDVLDFEYKNNHFYCNVYIPELSTEGLYNLFISFIVEDENVSSSSDIDLVLNYTYGGQR